MSKSKSLKLSDEKQKLILQRIFAAKEAHRKAFEIPQSSADAGMFNNSIHIRNQSMMDGEYWTKRNDVSGMMQINHVAAVVAAKDAVITGGQTAFTTHGKEKVFEDIATDVKGRLNCLWNSRNFDRTVNFARLDSSIHSFGVVEIGWKLIESDNSVVFGSRPQELIDLDKEKALAADQQEELEQLQQQMHSQMQMQGGQVGQMPPQGGQLGQGSPIPAGQDVLTQSQTQSIPPLGTGDSPPAQPDDSGSGFSLSTPAISGIISKPDESKEPIYDDPFIEHFDPCDFFVDPACTIYTLEDARYTFRRRYVRASELRGNPLYINNESLQGENRKYEDMDEDKIPDDLNTCEVFDGYMYLDRDDSGEEQFLHVLFCMENEMELLCEKTQYPFFAKTGNPHPFEVYVCEVTNTSKGIYCESDVSAIADIQRAFDESYTQIEYQRAHSPNVFGAPSSFIDTDAGAEFQQGVEDNRENVVLPIPAGITARVFGWLPRAPLHMDSEQAISATRKLMLERIGITEYQASGMPDKHVTKYEANQIASQGATRQSKDTQRFMEFIESLACKILILDQQFIERQKEYAVMDEGGNFTFGNIKAHELRNGKAPEGQKIDYTTLREPGIQFAISVDPSKRNPPNIYQQRDDAIKLNQALAPFFALQDPLRPGQPLIDARISLQSMIAQFEVPNGDQLIKNAPTGQEEQNIVQHLTGIIQSMNAELGQLKGAQGGAQGGQPPSGGQPPPGQGAPPPMAGGQ